MRQNIILWKSLVLHYLTNTSVHFAISDTWLNYFELRTWHLPCFAEIASNILFLWLRCYHSHNGAIWRFLLWKKMFCAQLRKYVLSYSTSYICNLLHYVMIASKHIIYDILYDCRMQEFISMLSLAWIISKVLLIEWHWKNNTEIYAFLSSICS